MVSWMRFFAFRSSSRSCSLLLLQSLAPFQTPISECSFFQLLLLLVTVVTYIVIGVKTLATHAKLGGQLELAALRLLLLLLNMLLLLLLMLLLLLLLAHVGTNVATRQ